MKTAVLNVSVILIIAEMLISCNKPTDSGDIYKDSRGIYNQAIEIHDEVMSKMGQIIHLQKFLKASKDTLADEGLTNQIDTAINDLEDAYDRMMTWMRNIPGIPEYNPNGNGEKMNDTTLPDPKELKKSQLKSLEEIKKVKIDINQSIQNADNLVELLRGS